MRSKYSAKLVFIITGLVSSLWILFRVITKPSRASYPCVRAAAPFMTAFVLYILSISSSVLALKLIKRRLGKMRFSSVAGIILVAIVSVITASMLNPSESTAARLVPPDRYLANAPVGVPQGIHPGRVVWVWDADATDSTCANVLGDYWFQNTDAAVVENMLSSGIMKLAGAASPEAGWEAIFRHFNNTHGRGDNAYQKGEKVYVKINLTNSCCAMKGTKRTGNFERMDATPELVLAMIKNLVVYAGVSEEDIYIGDPFRTFRDLYWNMCHAVYPNVNYCDGNGVGGRHQTVPTLTQVFHTSDGQVSTRIPQEYVDATYFINMACLKTHDTGGITLAAKNHQGSILVGNDAPTNQSAFIMHEKNYFPNPTSSMRNYRHLVDYMGHKDMGGKTLLAIVDGIWSGVSWEGFIEKWNMAPFNGDYTNSLFISQDIVAIEAVGWDFLLAEYANKDASVKYPYMAGVEDYILQAADPTQWPAGITYDPEKDGSALTSLGVYEHWNNAVDKQYSRNLGNGEGIELLQDWNPEIPQGPTEINQIDISVNEILSYPNPATRIVNLKFNLSQAGMLAVHVLNISGQEVAQLHVGEAASGEQQFVWDASILPAGIYLYKIDFENHFGEHDITTQVLVVQ